MDANQPHPKVENKKCEKMSRISHIINESDTISHQEPLIKKVQWQHDENASECLVCHQNFLSQIRKHHCMAVKNQNNFV